MVLLLAGGCPEARREEPRSDGAPATEGTRPDRTDAAPAPAHVEPAAAVDAGRPRDEPAPPPAGPCALRGEGFGLDAVVDADLAASPEAPLVVVVLERPLAEPLAMAGDEHLPAPRALYLVRGDGGSAPPTVERLASDPGPTRDPFERIVYERVAAARIACHGGGCVVASAVERRTPGAEGSAFTVSVTLLDDSGEVQGPPRQLAQEPDRGESLALCLGASSEGFVIGTSVAGGRGRMMWLDPRGTPLDARYVQGGFESCSAARSGPGVLVATAGPGGVELREVGASASPDAGPGSETGAAPEGASHPALAAVGASPLLVATVDGHVVAARGAEPAAELFDAAASSVAAAPSRDAALVLAVLGGRLAAARLDGGSRVTHRASDLGSAEQAWVAAAGDRAWAAWTESGALRLRELACGDDAGAAAAGGSPAPLPAAALVAADRAAAASIRARGRSEARRDPYRAAWLLEWGFSLDGQDPAALRDAAAALTGIRFTQAARRVLTRLSGLGTAEAQALLRSTCRDSDFERQWRMGEFQQLTGCAAPAARPAAADAGPAEEPEEG